MGATYRVYWIRECFRNVKVMDNGDNFFMGNSKTSDIQGVGKIVLKMTSGRKLTLNEVFYVAEIHKKLVSIWLLKKHGFRLVFDSDELVLTKNGVYVVMGYVDRGILKLCVMDIKPNESYNEMNNSSTYLIESSNIWHARLGHVNFDALHCLIKLNHIPHFHINSKYI